MNNNLKYNKHLFHVLNPSLWPFFLAMGIFFFVTGLAFSMHYMENSKYMLMSGLIMLVMTAFFWFLDMSSEAVILGDHTSVVSGGFKMGFLFFMASEMMLFFGFFWAFFASSLCPSIELGSMWPPNGIMTITVFEYPLFNTFMLMMSGFSVTWAHSGLSLGLYSSSIDGLVLTMLLGLFFMFLQSLEYFESTFNLQDGIYSSTFFLLTGLHGCHVIIGVFFLILCFMSLLFNHFLSNHYARFMFAVWYWHFVDIVWIILFLTLYCWGSW